MPFIDTRALKVMEPLPGWKGRFFRSDSMGFAHYEVDAGSSIHVHSHPNDEVWNVIDGEIEMTVDGVTQVAGPGSVVVVPPDVSHSARALTNARAIVVSYPVRHEIGQVKDL